MTTEATAKKRIALVYLGVVFGGISVYVKDISRLLQNDAVIFVVCVNRQMADLLRASEVRVLDCGFAEHWPKPLQLLIGFIVIAYLRVWQRIDTVWINGYSEILFLPYARLLGCKPLATRHLTLEFEGGTGIRRWKGQLARLLYRALAKTADKIICVSGVVAKDIGRIVSPKSSAVIPNWISSLPEPVKYHRQDGTPLKLLFVGRLARHKGVSLILDAMRQLEPDSVSLTIVGTGEQFADLELEAQGLDVRFEGFQSATAGFYQNADLFVNPSLGPEGLPLVSLEAMSYGLPCVFSDLPVHKEITDRGRCGLLFRNGDAADLRARILECMQSPQMLKRYGALGRSAIQNTYNADVAHAQYVKVLAL